MSVIQSAAVFVGLATLDACTTAAPPQGVAFGSPGGFSQASGPLSGAAPPTVAATYGTASYDDGYMYGRLTRTFQGGTQLATLEQIRYYSFFSMRSAEKGTAVFADRVAEITGCGVTNVSVRLSSGSWRSVTAVLDCR